MPRVKKPYGVKRVEALRAERDFFSGWLEKRETLDLRPCQVKKRATSKQGGKTKVRIVGHQLRKKTSSRRKHLVVETHYPLRESEIVIKVFDEQFSQEIRQLQALIREKGLRVKLTN